MIKRQVASFTALNASIKFDEFDIGGLQELTINESWNVKPVVSCGTRSPVALIPGFFNGDIVARKAFFEKSVLKDILTHHLRPTLKQGVVSGTTYRSIDSLKNSKKIETSLILNNTQYSNDLSHFEDIFENWDDLFYTLYFDISIKDEQNREIMLIRNCVLDSKRTSISQSGIIIMEDITFKFETFQKKT